MCLGMGQGSGYQKGRVSMNHHEIDRNGWCLAKLGFTLARWFVAYLVLHVCIAYGRNTQYEEDAESQIAGILVFSAIYVLLHVVNYIINQAIDSDGSGDRRAIGNIGCAMLVIILLITTFIWYCQPGEYAAYRRNDKKVLMEREAARKEAERNAAEKAEEKAAREAEERASARNSLSSSGSSGSRTTRSASQNDSYSYSSGGKSYSSSSKSAGSGVKSYSGSQPSNYGSKSYSSSKSSGSSSKSTSGKTYRNLNPYENYDDGYEAIYYDGEYDQDRYDRDPEYAEGVDDAMDELDEDG